MEGWSEVHTRSCNKSMKTSCEYAFGFTKPQPVSIWSKQLHSISTKRHILQRCRSPYHTGIFNCFSQSYLPPILIFFWLSIKRICWDFSESNLHGLLNIFCKALSVSEILKSLANNICDLPSQRNGTVKGQYLPAPFYSMEQTKILWPGSYFYKKISTAPETGSVILMHSE